MLTAIAIRDVVLIEALDLQFGAGLGVLTGETGAGKSILLDSVGLALGARGDSGLVRHGAAQASVTATFDLPADLAPLLDDNGIEVDAGEQLIIRRVVKADGGSRAFVNNQPVSAALLREIGARLVEIHGQHDDRGLLNPRGHRALLDLFGRCDTAPTAAAWSGLRTAEDALAAARAELETVARDREWLEHAVAELTALAHALSAIDRAVIEADAAEDRLREARAALACDPRALEDDEARLFELRAMARKHRVQPDDLADLATELRARLDRLEAGEGGIAKLEADVSAARDTYATAAAALSQARTAAATRLDAAVAGELAPLKLDAARFRTAVAELPKDARSAAGRDRVEFEISTNPGAPFAPLTKIASGGELSRFILALKVALAEEGGAATMIFDEIDRGVGGAVASAIGERLARLAERTQLLVVTHSPQVAARGAEHLLIAKASDGTVTRTSVRQLDGGERREEIARMLSGATVTDEARAQAERLIEMA